MIFFMICTVFATAAGQNMGNNFVNGDNPESMSIHFQFLNETAQHFSDDVKNDPLLLITYRENCYYVLPLNKSKIQEHHVYIIPDQEVVSVKLDRVR
jgi:hypothetical protein